MTVRIAMWSGPRNISTAMMRSFGARADCVVSDEPFFGAYLKATGDPQPMAAETMAAMDCDYRSVLRTISSKPPPGAVNWYQKHMPHHMVGDVGIADMPDHRHAFLIRAPERVVASYAAKREGVDAARLGYARIRQYVEHEAARTGRTPPILDADDVLTDPGGMLAGLCAALGIEWDAAMLSWARGPHAEDGVWGAHWYGAVNASTGFAPPPGDLPVLDVDNAAIAGMCRDDYAWLHERRVTPQ
ncbi:MAG: HAD family hydrolase [Pacificimonas sp.]